MGHPEFHYILHNKQGICRLQSTLGHSENSLVRYRVFIQMSVKFVSAILGPEMAAPIVWTPGKMRSCCRKTHVHKIPRFRGGFWGGGGSADFIFMGARIFLIYGQGPHVSCETGPFA